MLLPVARRKKGVHGYKCTCLRGKHMEVIGQAMVFCFQKWEGSQATVFMNLTQGMKTEVSEKHITSYN